MADPIHRLLAAAREDGARQIFLVHGDLVLAEPAALAVASGLAAHHGGRVEAHRRPTSLGPLLQDLRTFSLFGSAKVLLAIDTFVFADRSAAADLIDDAGEALPLAAGDDGAPALSARERQAASRLMQALRLFEIEAGPGTGQADEILARLPAWVFEGGKAARRGRGGRARGKRQVEELRQGLAELVEAARQEGVEGRVEGDLSDLAELISGGLPSGHFLVFAERDVAAGHPLARLLGERGAVAAVGEVEAERGGWLGVDLVAAELERQTGIGISREALNELARRTLRKPGDRPAAGRGAEAEGASVTADSTARLAGEYRKLANLAGAGAGVRIELRMVEESVEDRGEEDVWKLLDAIGAGHGGEAMDRLQRLLAAADDPAAARLSFFSLLATFCRRLTAIRGMMRVARVRGGEANYKRFEERLAPALQGALPGGKNLLAGVKTYPLYRAYLAASRLPEAVAALLPWEVLETELQLKGESGEADAALARLVIHLSTAATAASSRRSAPGAPPARGRPGA
jgi:hypothetical protein